MRFRLVATQEEMVKSCSRKGFERVEEKRTSDFRRRTSADVSGGRCMRRPYGWRVARNLKSEVGGCENAWGLSPRSLFLTRSRRGAEDAEVRVKKRMGTVPSEFSFTGDYTIDVDCRRCVKTLTMRINNTFNMASATRIPGTRSSLIKRDILNPVYQTFAYDVEKPTTWDGVEIRSRK